MRARLHVVAAVTVLSACRVAAVPQVVADGQNLRLQVDSGADVIVDFGSGNSPVSVRDLQDEVSILRSELSSMTDAVDSAKQAAIQTSAEDASRGRMLLQTRISTAEEAISSNQDLLFIASTARSNIVDNVATTQSSIQPLQSYMALTNLNASCAARIATALPPGAQIIRNRCDIGEGGVCEIGCQPGLNPPDSRNLAVNRSVQVTGAPFLRNGEARTSYPPAGAVDGIYIDFQNLDRTEQNRWLAWCDSGTAQTRPNSLADQPCVITVELEAEVHIDQVMFSISHGSVVCQHQVQVYTGSNNDLQAVHSSNNNNDWLTVVDIQRPMNRYRVENFPQTTGKFVRFQFNFRNSDGNFCFRPDQYAGLLRLNEIEIFGGSTVPLTCQNGQWTSAPDNWACIAT